MVDITGNVDRSFFVLEHDFAGDRIWGDESAEVTRREGVHDRVCGVGGVCGVEGGEGVYFFVRDGFTRAEQSDGHIVDCRAGAQHAAPLQVDLVQPAKVQSKDTTLIQCGGEFFV